MSRQKTGETQSTKMRASEQVELVRVSLDELNLATFPVSVLDKKAQRSHEPLQFHDMISVAGRQVERHWKVFPHQEEGFPGPADDDVLMALFEFTREQGCGKKIYFTRYQLCKKLGWPLNSFYYGRIASSLRKLAALYIEATNAYDDQERKKFINIGFTIIQEFKLYDETAGRETLSYLIWSDRIVASISRKLTKYLDASFYFEELDTPLERRLFRYLDNHFDQTSRQLSLNIHDLCYEHLGIARRYRYISQLMQKLEGPLQRLVEKGFLIRWRQEGTTLFVFGADRFAERVDLSIPLSEIVDDISDTQTEYRSASSRKIVKDRADRPLLSELVSRGVEMGVARDIATRAAGRFEREVMDAIHYFDAELARGKRFENPAGLLVSLIRKSLPPEEAPPARRVKKTREQNVSSAVYGLMSEKVLPASSSNGAMDREHAEIKYNEYLNNVGRQAFEALSASDQMRLLSAAQAEIKSGPYASKYQRMPSEKFAEHLRVMVETKLS